MGTKKLPHQPQTYKDHFLSHAPEKSDIKQSNIWELIIIPKSVINWLHILPTTTFAMVRKKSTMRIVELFNWPFLCGRILRMGFPCYILLSPISTFPTGVNIGETSNIKTITLNHQFFLVTISPIDFLGFFFHFFRIYFWNSLVLFVFFWLFFS